MKYDCIVVGAGAAGIGAGLALQQHKASFIILEAKNRLGGRAFSEALSPDQMFDHGCHWFHSASINPLRQIALEINHPFTDKTVPYTSTLWRSGQFMDPDPLDEDITAMHERVIAAGKRGEDVAAAEMLDRASLWHNTIAHDFALTYSQDVDAISTVDATAFHDTGENIPVSGGYGALIVRMGAALPTRLGVRVSAIVATGQGINVETGDGTLEARSVIVAVPQRVLSGGGLTFRPGLPLETAEAIDNVPMGWFEKSAFVFDRPVFGVHAGVGLEAVASISGLDWPVAFQLGSGAAPVAIAHVAGKRARELSQEERTQCCEEALVQCFGSEIRARITRRQSTNWGGDPDIGGAYSCARPGYAYMRKRLQQTIHGRIFLAGEHTSLDAMATAHGAYVSGQRAAHAALANVKD